MKGFRRPKMEVLPEQALPPEGNLVKPPEELTHVLTQHQPYFYSPMSTEPAGNFDAGTKVALLGVDGGQCRVVNEHGLSVFTSCEGVQSSDRSASKARRPAGGRAASKRAKRQS